jgi:hypothetical protein
MAIDYEQICKDNIEEYGKGTRHLEFFERLYSDGTHFIFELLQNAEDAQATRIEFVLFNDRLEVRHDGRPFNEKDVRGVCGVGESTKGDDLTQIGRFGIGFKSVYAFTKSPIIHCGDEHFQIRNYVRPYAVAGAEIEKPWTTLFIIPFDKTDVSSDFAVTEIAKRLRGLSARTLLFLARVSEIEYRIANGGSGTYLKSTKPCIDSTLVTVIGEKAGALEVESEEWLVFQRSILDEADAPVVCANGAQIPPVQIAFLLEEEEAATKKSKSTQKKVTTRNPWTGKRISSLTKSPLVVFFATEKESQLGFLVQGPYRTTPARDNIPSHDAWNQKLIDETASLLVQSVLPKLKEMDLLTVSCFDAFPIDMDDFPEDGFFFPIADEFRSALESDELLPAADGSFVAGEQAVLGRGEDLRSLLGNDQLKLLFDLKSDVKWLSGEITPDNAPTLRDYLRNELSVQEVTPDSFAPKITADFMDQQSDDWVISFYGCLLSWEALWKPRRDSLNRATLRDRPFLRLECKSHVPPFDANGHPNAYLPLKGTTQLPIVRRSVAADKSARDFLTRLGISEPDIVAEVIEEILPLYLSADSAPSATDHAEHMKEILAAWSTDSITKREQLEEKLSETPFVRYHCRATGVHGYAEPGDVYFADDDLLLYFAGNEDAKFVVTSYSNDVRELLSELNVTDVPRCFEVAHGNPPQMQYSTRGSRIKNYVLDGLEDFLVRMVNEEDNSVRISMALLLWQYLRAYAESDQNCFLATRYYFYYSPSQQVYDALFVTTLRETEWIPVEDGFAKPPDVSIDQLPKEFEPNQKLIAALKIKPDPTQQVEQERQAQRNLAKVLGISLEDAEFIRQNRDEFEHFRQATLQRGLHQQVIEDAPSRNRERRRTKLLERRERAPTKESVMKLRAVPNYSRSEIDRQALFAFYYDEDEGVVFCQMCLDLMPFVKRNGEDCGECVDLFTQGWADANDFELKVLTSLNLVLCPVCSEIYRDYVHKDLGRQTDLFDHLTTGDDKQFVVCESDIRRDHRDCVLHFNQTHLGDIKDCLEENCN